MNIKGNRWMRWCACILCRETEYAVKFVPVMVAHTQPDAHVAHVNVLENTRTKSFRWCIWHMNLVYVCGPENCRACCRLCMSTSGKCACFCFMNWNRLQGVENCYKNQNRAHMRRQRLCSTTVVSPCASESCRDDCYAIYRISLSALVMSRSYYVTDATKM